MSILKFFPGTPRPGQVAVLQDLERSWTDYDVHVLQLPVACHAVGESVLLSSGLPCAVEQIQVGDSLLGPDGLPRQVLKVYKGTAELYKITPKRGRPWIVTGDHTLVIDRATHDNLSGRYEVSVKDWLTWPKSVKYESFQISTGYPGVTQQLPLDPYIFGLWLGDGHSKDAALTTADVECRDAWYTWAKELESVITVHQKNNNRAATYRIMGRPNKACAILRSMNVLDNKHIPDIYLMASEQQRAELLAGLLDSDGNVLNRGWEWSQKNKVLLEQVWHLCRSLGMQCKKGFRSIKGQEYGRLHISVTKNSSKIPVRLERKKVTVNTYQDSMRSRFNIESIGPGEYCGFLVDMDHLYLTSDFVITHNCGKTKIAQCIQRWVYGTQRKKAHVAVPNNLLVAQLRKENPRICTLEKKENYRCTAVRAEAVMPDASCEARHKAQGFHCSDCPYLKAVRTAHGMSQTASNYHTVLAHKLYKNVMIYDEAHLLLGLVRELEATKVWLHKLPGTVASALRKVHTYVELAAFLEEHEEVCKSSEALRQLQQDLFLGGKRWLVSREDQYYHGSYRECLSLLPLDTSQSKKAQHLWPSRKTQKVVLMSATIDMPDVEQLGLAGRRVRIYSGQSPIPAERRPWAYLGKQVGSMARNSQNANLGRCVQELTTLAHRHQGKGLVHAPYNLAEKLGPALRAGLLGTHRVFLHNSADKMQQYEAWRAHQGPAVFVASGFHEGVDLAGAQFAWQALCKVPFPSLEDPALRCLAEEEPKRYAWITARELLQAYGRICRGPEDQGVTYFLDGSFRRFYTQHKKLFPSWFTEAGHLDGSMGFQEAASPRRESTGAPPGNLSQTHACL